MAALQTQQDNKLEEVIKNLVRDVAAGVHAMYRGDIRAETAQVRMSAFVAQARDALLPLLAGGSSYGAAAFSGAAAAHAAGLMAAEVSAITRCIMAWGPMGSPAEATAESRCVPGAKELVPSWGDREKAREAIRRLAGS
jgi:hypothetical protein